MATSTAQGLGDIGSAVTDLFGASASADAAGSYTTAEQIANQNAEIAKNVTATQELQTQRQIYQTIGTQEAQVGGNGMAESGSALWLMQNSASQGAITKATAEQQGAITQNSYKAQANVYGGLAGAANATSTGQTAGGVLDIVGAIASFAGL